MTVRHPVTELSEPFGGGPPREGEEHLPGSLAPVR
jgi:hypothetical protein